MFEVPTVLVLGAGASWHYGYPLGEDLIDEIIDNASQKKYKGTTSFNLAEELKFYDPLSIDSFLNFRNHDLDLVNAGKIEIGKVILKAEDREHFNRNNKTYNPISQKHEIRGNWYKFISNAITNSIETPFDLLEKPLNLTIITFNYDLSLEYFLYSRFKKIPNFTDEQNKAFLLKLNKSIIHVYGQVGTFKWQGGDRDDNEYGYYKSISRPPNNYDLEEYDFVDFKEQKITDYAKRFAAQIRLINERKIDKSNIHSTLLESERIYFLGFGFDKTNCNELNITKNCARAKSIHYTNFQDSLAIRNRSETELFHILEYKLGDSYNNIARNNFNRFCSTKNVHEALKYDFSLI